MRWWHIPLFMMALALFAIAMAPMRAFAPSNPGAFSFASVEGSIWRAQFRDARFGPFAAGAASWRLSPIDLVQGRLIGDLEMKGGELQGALRILANARGDRRVVTQAMSMAGVPLGATMLKGGVTRALDVDILFQKGRCARAQGKFETDVFTRQRALLGGFGPVLYGEARCNGASAEIPLHGREGDAGLTILLTLAPDGGARWRATLDGASPQTQAAFGLFGFRAAETGAPLTLEGETTWLAF
jgi:hypothetical protein